MTLKSAVGLTNQPKVDLAATTGYKDIVAGGEATYDSAKGQVTKWAAGVGARSCCSPPSAASPRWAPPVLQGWVAQVIGWDVRRVRMM